MPIKKVEVEYCPESSLGVTYHPRVWRNVKQGMVYVDVGAHNGGTVSRTLRHYPHLKVVAIEPIPKRLLNMFEIHPEIMPNTTFINKGCWSEKRRHQLYLRHGKLSGSTIGPDHLSYAPGNHCSLPLPRSHEIQLLGVIGFGVVVLRITRAGFV